MDNMIPVTIIKAIYIRTGPGLSFGYLGIMPASGNVVNMEGAVTGEAHKGINTWYYLVNDKGDRQYYWAGGISIVLPPAIKTFTTAIYPQWMMDLQLPAIWATATGKGVGVAVVDTGIASGIVDLPYDTSKVFTYAAGVSPADGNGHGSNCAGLIGARNRAGNYMGVAPDCKLFNCKIADNAFFDAPSDMMRYAAAINWCAAQPEIHIISISWGNKIADANITKAIQDAVDNAVKNNKIVVCAMGEAYSFGESSELFPAAANDTFGIGAIPVTDILYPFVNAHLTAVTTGVGMASYYKNGSMVTMNGTSQANAVAAGIIALLIQKARFNYTPASIRQTLQQVVRPVSYTADNTTLSLPVIDGSLLLQHFTSLT